MQPFAQPRAALTALLVILTGCASPGVPRSPSLNLPEPIRDLTANRQGDTVTLRFSVPQRNTDHLPLRGDTLSATICRAVDTAPCVNLPPQSFSAHFFTYELRDTLSSDLIADPAKPLAYRIQLANQDGHAAGLSDAAYAASGPAPAAVQGLAAEGSRLGVVLSWLPISSDDSQMLIHREDLNAKPAPPKNTAMRAPTKARRNSAVPSAAHVEPKPGDNLTTVLLTRPSDLTSPPSNVSHQPAQSGNNILLDATALADEPYRYTAQRSRILRFGGRTLELRGELSAPVAFTLHDTFSPPVPTDIAAAVANHGVDLIWQPVDDPGLAGYNIYRQAIGSNDAPTRLNATPVAIPGYHDALPTPSAASYTYSVTAVDLKGNESAPCITAIRVPQP